MSSCRATNAKVSVIPANSKLRLAFLDGDKVLFDIEMTPFGAESIASDLRKAIASLTPSTLRVVK